MGCQPTDYATDQPSNLATDRATDRAPNGPTCMSTFLVRLTPLGMASISEPSQQFFPSILLLNLRLYCTWTVRFRPSKKLSCLLLASSETLKHGSSYVGVRVRMRVRMRMKVRVRAAMCDRATTSASFYISFHQVDRYVGFHLCVEHTLALDQTVAYLEYLAGYHLGLWLVLPQANLG